MNDCDTCEEPSRKDLERKPTMYERNLYDSLELLFKVYKEKYDLELDAEINIPKTISGESTFFYVLFVRGRDKDKDKVLPILRIVEKLDNDNSESNMRYVAYENTLKILVSDAIIKEISDKARLAQEQRDKVPEGKDDTDIRQQPLRPEDAIAPEEVVEEKPRRSKKNKK